MSFDALLVHSARIHRMTTESRDRYNNRAYASETDPDADVVPARFDPLTADEDLRDREQQTERYVVFLKPSTVLAGFDEIEWTDHPGGMIRLKVDGEPGHFFDSVADHHLEAIAYRISG